MMSAMTGTMIQAALLVMAILIVRKLFGDKLHAYVRYGLWLLVVLRLLVPVNLVDSSFSVLRIEEAMRERLAETGNGIAAPGGRSENRSLSTTKPQGNQGTDEIGQIQNGHLAGKGMETGLYPQDNLADDNNDAGKAGRTIQGKGRYDLDSRFTRTFCIIWFAGSLVTGGFFAVVHSRFRRKLYRMRNLYRPKQKAGNAGGTGRPGRNLEIYQVEKLETPCLVGIVHPAIYIGTGIRTGTDQFRYVITHEQVHYFHGDPVWALLRTVLVTVYWFHPFVWIAAVASARDGEIACDYGTVRRLGEEERLPYGEMLLKLSGGNRGGRIYSFGTMLRPGKSEIKERIMRVAQGDSAGRPAGILAVALMLVLAGCAFTGAAGGEYLSGGADAPDNGRAGEEEFDPDETITKPRPLAALAAEISGETQFGADGPTLDYAGRVEWEDASDSVIMFHDYFGLIVYDLTQGKILRSLDLKAIGCHFTQGDNVCQVAVSADGMDVWLHPLAKRYMFHYEVDTNALWQLPLVNTFEIDLEAEDLFDRYLVTEEQYMGWHSNYLYEEYKDESGLQTAYIYLCIPSEETQRIGSLQCVWDDMVFLLWDENGASPEQTASAGEFPYRYDGAVNEVWIKYDEPCEYSRIADSFGERTHPVTGEVRVHEGIDYAAEEGTAVTAAADGIVYETGYSAEYGNYVVLLHQNGDMTYYCCCRDVIVSQDEQVKRGDQIATVGATGRATGSHLHFALSRDGAFVDPVENMSLDEFDHYEF